MDASIPVPQFRLGTEDDPSGLIEWLGVLGLSDLADTLLSADERETWVLDHSDSDFRQRVDQFYADLQNLPHEAARLEFPEERALIDTLACNRASRAVQILAAVNERFDGFVEKILSDARRQVEDEQGPTDDPARNVFLTRLVYLIRLDALQTIFSPERRAEVLRAIESAEGENP